MDNTYVTAANIAGFGFSSQDPRTQNLDEDGLHCSCCEFPEPVSERGGRWVPAEYEDQRCQYIVLLVMSTLVKPVLMSCRDIDQLGELMRRHGCMEVRKALEEELRDHPSVVGTDPEKIAAEVGADAVVWEKLIQEMRAPLVIDQKLPWVA